MLLVTDAVFWAEMQVAGSRVGRMGGRTDRRMDTSPRTAVVFFSSYKLPKTVKVTTLILFGHITLLCGKFLFIKLSEGPVQLSDCTIDSPPLHATGLSIHTGLVH